MKKGFVLVVIAILLSVPLVSAVQPNASIIVSKETTTVLCMVDGKKVEKEMSIADIQNLIDMGKSHHQDFLTIYDKTTSDQEVATAMENIKPFFQALIDNGLTGKTVDELTALYYGIKEKIAEPKRQPSWKSHGGNGAKPLGIWNGIPTPIWANALCGIFDTGTCVGFALGTHTLIPTIGIDLFITYAFTGESMTVGLSGGTLAVAAFQVIIGFIGVLICTPIIMVGPYFMTGLCGILLGIGA